jgi:hypothetical protein
MYNILYLIIFMNLMIKYIKISLKYIIKIIFFIDQIFK